MRTNSDNCAETDWTHKRLGEICRPMGGGTPSRSQPQFWRGEIPWASVKDFTDHSVVLNDTQEHITREGLESSAARLVAENTPVVCTRMAVGRCALTTRATAINQDLKALKLNGEFDPRYFIRLLRHHAPDLDRLSIGSTVRGISTSDLVALNLCFPEKPEQERIAAVLNTIDGAIARTETAIAKLRMVRAGLRHDLLTRGIDENGELRDPIAEPDQFRTLRLGTFPRDWHCTKFNEVLESIEAGKSPDYPDHSAPPGEWGVLKVSAIWPEGFRPHENKRVTKTADQVSAYQVRNGDLLISRSNTYELVGLVCLVANSPKKLMLSDKTLRLTLTSRGLNEFFCLLLQTRIARTQIEINATGTSGSMKNISQHVIRKLWLAYPEVDEQKRILEKLRPISDELTALSDELSKLKSLKAGLTNDLLSGRVRVPKSIGATA